MRLEAPLNSVKTYRKPLTMHQTSRAERDAALETGMADGVAIGYDRLDEILASTGSRK